MLSKRENFLETIRGGSPERFVNQFEPFGLMWGLDPLSLIYPLPAPGEESVNGWGITHRFEPGTPAPMPVHDAEHLVIKDICTWRDVVKAPSLEIPESAWGPSEKRLAALDRSEQFVTMVIMPGIFEMTHYLMGMENCMISLATEPDEMKALIDYYTNWEISYARMLIERWHPEALFHHDDWGAARSTMLSVAMFDEFFLPAYKRLYGFYKDKGIEVIVHHSDSYAATLVPSMIEMGIDVWQGCMSTNNTPELIREYGGQISFMGDIDNAVVDREGWTEALIAREVERACTRCGKKYYIPDLIIGGPGSTYPGVYQEVSKQIDRMSKLMFSDVSS
jgi:hypothetical protein